MAYVWHIISGGSDSNSGTDVNTASFGSGTVNLTAGTNPTLVIPTASFTSTPTTNDSMRLNGQTGGRNSTDIYPISAVSTSAPNYNITITGTVTTVPGVTFAVGGAFATRQRGLNVVTSGETIKICGDLTVTGTGDTGVPAVSGTSSLPIRIQGCDTLGVALSGNNYATIDMVNYAVNCWHDTGVARAWYEWKNIKVIRINSSYYGWYQASSGSDGWNCHDCYASGNASNAGTGWRGSYEMRCVNCIGASISNAFYGSLHLLRCKATGNSGYGFIILNASTGSVIECEAYNNYAGFRIYSPTVGCFVFRNCNAMGNTNNGFRIEYAYAHSTFIENCISAFNGAWGIELAAASTTFGTLTGILTYSNTSGGVQTANMLDTAQLVNNVTSDPLLKDYRNGNYVPQNGSPCLIYNSDGTYDYIGRFMPDYSRQVLAPHDWRMR